MVTTTASFAPAATAVASSAARTRSSRGAARITPAAVAPKIRNAPVVCKAAASSAASSSRFEGRPTFVGASKGVPASRVVAAKAGNGSGGSRTMFDKIWDDHVIESQEDGTALIYIDRHLVHEVTSPQAFEGLRDAGRSVRQPGNTLATVDHNVPTSDRSDFTTVEKFIEEVESRTQVLALEDNVAEFGVTYYGIDSQNQGIVHIIGPEQGFTVPGATCVCGDSHTATHGAFGALAFGIGTSEVEHVLATQTLLQKKPQNMKIEVTGSLLPGVTSKDIVLHIIGVIGTAGGTGSVIEFCGTAIEELSMEARMSICNMAIEGGARAGMIAPDEITFEYLKGRPMAPKGELWDKAVKYWKTLTTDEGAHYDTTVTIRAEDIAPTVTWGTSPQDVVPVTGQVPDPADAPSEQRKAAMERSLQYMGLTAGQKIDEIPVEMVFIGSCTNGRIEDIRQVAAVAEGRQVAAGVTAMVVPGSGNVKEQAEAEGLHTVLMAAGFDWREPGCSMCLAMNPDKLTPGQRCASTSNRNFEGRQGGGGRTHLVSPAMAAAAAVTGKLTDVRDLLDVTNLGAEYAAAATDGRKYLDMTPPQLPEIKAGSSKASGGAGGMPKFTNLKGVAAKLDVQNVDTDMIIPKQFLKTIKRTGLGVSLFYEMRFKGDTGVEVEDFILNQDRYRDTKILVAGDNFGCGSSREHAPWAINDFGIRCVISTSFADIFFNNCFKNGMLPIKLPEEQVRTLMADSEEGEIEVDLPSQTIVRPNGETIGFEVDAFRKHCLLNGLDDIGLTLLKGDAIDTFEGAHHSSKPWLQGIGAAFMSAV